MKRRIVYLLLAITLLLPISAFAVDGSGPSTSGYLMESWGFPPVSSDYIFNFCAADQYGGLWHLTASNGTITGYRDNVSDCVWNIIGSNAGANFHMDLILSAGSACCTSGYTDGTASKKTKSAQGLTYWTGNCSSGPWEYTWTVCPR